MRQDNHNLEEQWLELKELLISKGYKFQTTSDTEVILNLYDEFGDNCLQYLRGMFAFAIADRRRRELFVARDRFGEKPLYWGWAGETLVFGSELKAVIAPPGVPRRHDGEGKRQGLRPRRQHVLPGPRGDRPLRELRDVAGQAAPGPGTAGSQLHHAGPGPGRGRLAVSRLSAGAASMRISLAKVSPMTIP